MARKKKGAEAPAAAEGAAAPAGKGKSNTVPALLIAAGLVVGGFLMRGGGGGAAPAHGEAAPTTTAPLGSVYKLDPVTLNLADGHYLKVGIALQLSQKASAEHMKETGHALRALDIAISELQHKTMAELRSPAARDEVKAHISEKVAHAFHEEVLGILITEFVMQ